MEEKSTSELFEKMLKTIHQVEQEKNKETITLKLDENIYLIPQPPIQNNAVVFTTTSDSESEE